MGRSESKAGQLVECLTTLEGAHYYTRDAARRSSAVAAQALELLFKIGKQKETFTDEQKKELVRLILATFHKVQGHIERVGCVYRTRLDTATLRKRSALQFLVDDYGNLNLPNSTNTLIDILRMNGLQQTIAIIDDIICKWHNESDSEVDSDRETTGLPNTHTWWDL